jgi:nitrite reductase (NADH) large subunit
VRAVTKASASCGQCTAKVESAARATLGDNFRRRPAPSRCANARTITHSEVRKAIVEGVEVHARRDAGHWNGKPLTAAPSCRPALNYYLLCAWPGEYADDAQSRYINERVHANIQKDGTYSVVPRMWGGMTTPDELRAIADVADKFEIPTVKVTGGQRIDLLGVKKDDLPAVWATQRVRAWSPATPTPRACAR